MWRQWELIICWLFAALILELKTGINLLIPASIRYYIPLHSYSALPADLAGFIPIWPYLNELELKTFNSNINQIKPGQINETTGKINYYNSN